MSSSLTYTSALELATSTIEGDGYTTDLWVPEFGWSPCEIRQSDDDEASASDEPYPLQLLAAYQIFVNMFTSQTVWVHLAAEMQAGKTGVISALFRLILANSHRIGITPNRIFTLTGMSDDDWQGQTSERLPKILRENVHHSGTLFKVSAKLRSLKEREGELRNILIALDESHHASSSANRPNTLVYRVVEELCPKHLWAERGIRFVTVSATDPAKVLAMQGSEDVPTQVVRLETTEVYQSVQSMSDSGRLLPVQHVLHTPEGASMLCEQVRKIEAEHGPLIHILRPNRPRGKDTNTIVENLLKERISGCVVIPWDLESKKRRLKEASDSLSSSSTDINSALLSAKPERTTFILLKGMFRAAKTLNDEHVGVLYESVGGADSTNLQSLLGRACGYRKSTRTIVFVAKSTVTTYLTLWRELCAQRNFPTVTNVPIALLKGKMPGVRAILKEGRSCLLLKEASACPISGAGGGNVTDARRRRIVSNDDDFNVEWSAEFITEAEARAAGGKKMKMKDGFFSNAMGGKGPMTREHLIRVRAGKKTAHSRIHLRPEQRVDHKTFAFYENPLDASTVRFIVRTLTRIA